MKNCLRYLLILAMVSGIGFTKISAQEKKAAAAEKKEEQPAEEKKDDGAKKSDVYTIGEIVIKEKALANVQDASTTTIITAKDLKARSEKTLDQALQTVPGMIIKQGQKGQMNFDMRGFQHSALALLVDGLPFEEIYDGGGGDISRINVMNASEIIVNRGTSSALYGSRGAFGSINVITKKPDRLSFEGSTEFDQNGGFSVNASGGAAYKNFYFTLAGSVIKNNSYKISSRLGKFKRLEWMNRLIPWYVYGYTPFSAVVNTIGLEYVLDNNKWNHTNSIKYYASGKAGYAISKNIEFGVSASYYQGESNFNGFEPSSYSSYLLDGNWDDPSANNMIQNRAWHWPKDYRVNVAPYLTLEFGEFYLKAMYYYTRQANVLEGWRNQAQTSMHDRGKISEYGETSHGMYIYPSYKFASWNKLNAVAHYRIDEFIAYKKRLAAYASGSPNYNTPWFKTQELSAKYITAALEDEFKFTAAGQIIKFALGISYDAQMLSRNLGGRNDVLQLMRSRQKPNNTADVWGTSDSFNPVFSFTYEPVVDMLKLRGTLSKKVKFPSLHDFSDTADYIDTYFEDDPALLPLVIKLNQVRPETAYNANGGFEINLFEKVLNLRGDYFYAFYKNRIESVADPNAAVQNLRRKTNVRGREVHGVETAIGTTIGKDKLKFLEISSSLTYVFTHARNWYDAPTIISEYAEDVPEHQIILQLKLDFTCGTSLNLWTNHTMNQIVYVQKWPTSLLGTPSIYTPWVYTTRQLHNTNTLDIKVSQNIVEHFDLWVMCKNVLDDYNADPLNPGEGRTWYFGASAEY